MNIHNRPVWLQITKTSQGYKISIARIQVDSDFSPCEICTARSVCDMSCLNPSMVARLKVSEYHNPSIRSVTLLALIANTSPDNNVFVSPVAMCIFSHPPFAPVKPVRLALSLNAIKSVVASGSKGLHNVAV